MAIYRTIHSLGDVIKLIRTENNVTIPENNDDYDVANVMCIDVRRNYFLRDAMRECKKSKFDPKKVIKVNKLLLIILIRFIHVYVIAFLWLFQLSIIVLIIY